MLFFVNPLLSIFQFGTVVWTCASDCCRGTTGVHSFPWWGSRDKQQGRVQPDKTPQYVYLKRNGDTLNTLLCYAIALPFSMVGFIYTLLLIALRYWLQCVSSGASHSVVNFNLSSQCRLKRLWSELLSELYVALLAELLINMTSWLKYNSGIPWVMLCFSLKVQITNWGNS